MRPPIGISFLGGGPVTQAIHLPILAGMADEWRVQAVMDVNPEVARIVAERCGALPVTDVDAVLADPAVEVVAICSPNAFHARQLIAAARAGKRGALVEKPLATSREEAAAIEEAIAETGMTVLVGTMHWYDPGFQAALAAWESTGGTANYVKSAVYLPANGTFVGLATEQAFPSPPPPVPPAEPTPDYQRERLAQTILGLAIHHIPLVRRFFPAVGAVIEARRDAPFGYSLLLRNGEQIAELLALMPGRWPVVWSFEAASSDRALHVEFPPSYVAAGSGRATLSDANGSRSFAYAENGYAAQWRHLHAAVSAGEPLGTSMSAAAADLHFALDLVERAIAIMEIAI